MTIEAITGTSYKYYLVAFGSDGRERTDDPDGLMSDRVTAALQSDRPSDVFLLSHGWKGDVPAARQQYDAWMRAMLSCTRDLDELARRRTGFKPMLIGLHWPSLPFGDEDLAGEVSFSPSEGQSVEMAVERYADRIADTSAARAALRTIFEAAEHEIAPAKLPPDVREAYNVLNRESAMGSIGVGGSPSDDREPFDPDAAYAIPREVCFDCSIVGGLLSPLVQLSFWKMKDRARSFGESGGFRFLASLMNGAGELVRFHLMGHSFGCIACSAIACGPTGNSLPRPLSSVVLVQGALSLWSYCSSIPHAPSKQGYFRRLVADRIVSGPIVTTQSDRDTAVGRLYPIAAGVAQQLNYVAELPKYGGLGTFGARGVGLETVDAIIEDESAVYNFRPGIIYNLDGSKIISQGSPPSGAHNDIAKPEVGHVVLSAAFG